MKVSSQPSYQVLTGDAFKHLSRVSYKDIKSVDKEISRFFKSNGLANYSSLQNALGNIADLKRVIDSQNSACPDAKKKKLDAIAKKIEKHCQPAINAKHTVEKCKNRITQLQQQIITEQSKIIAGKREVRTSLEDIIKNERRYSAETTAEAKRLLANIDKLSFDALARKCENLKNKHWVTETRHVDNRRHSYSKENYTTKEVKSLDAVGRQWNELQRKSERLVESQKMIHLSEQNIQTYRGKIDRLNQLYQLPQSADSSLATYNINAPTQLSSVNTRTGQRRESVTPVGYRPLQDS